MTPTKCPYCRRVYILGLDGTVDGCDQCEGVVRNPLDHTIIKEVFSFEVECTCDGANGSNLRCPKHGVIVEEKQ